MGRPRLPLLLASTLLSFTGSLLHVNAPSIGSGWGLITIAVTLAALLLPPSWAALTILLGGLAALPLQLASKSIFATVAVAGLLVRPPVAAVASHVARRHGALAAALTVGGLSGLATTVIAIAYYGDDGIHASLAVFDLITALLTLPAAIAYTHSSKAAAAGVALAILYWLSTYSYYSHAAPAAAAGLLAIALTARRRPELLPRAAAAGMAATIVVAALALQPILLNAKILSYPLNPKSYTGERWTTGVCAGTTSPFQEVHDPERLRIVEDCVTVEGIVGGIPSTADDGDYNIDLETSDVNLPIGNKILRKGRLHVEIVPADIDRLLAGVEGKVCKGDKIQVTGTLVVDTDHAQWLEIHPAHDIKLIQRGPGPCVTVETNR